MLGILLNVSEEAIVHSSPTAIAVAFVLSAAVFGVILYFLHKNSNNRLIEKKGGIRGCCPNLVDFLMKHYPLARIISESPIDIFITAADISKPVKMGFYLEFNNDFDIEIKGEIIPDREKMPDSKPKKFVWVISNNDNAFSDELMVINEIKKDMVLTPETK